MSGVLNPPLPERSLYSGPDDLVANFINELKDQEKRLNELLEAIENRDITLDQVKENLKMVHKNAKKLRKSPTFGLLGYQSPKV